MRRNRSAKLTVGWAIFALFISSILLFLSLINYDDAAIVWSAFRDGRLS